MIKYIGIKKIWYTGVLNAAPTTSSVKALLNTATEVKNVHSATWGYTQDDPSFTDYINQLDGTTYYREKTSDGTKTINFTMGEFEYQNKADLQGGSVIMESETAVGWEPALDTSEIIEKCIIAQTKTGNYIVFPNAGITGKTDMQEQALGLGVAAVALRKIGAQTTMKDEYWFDGSKVDA